MTRPSTLRRIGLAAAQIGVSRDTIERAIKAGKLTRHKLGVMTFVDMAQVQDWLASGEQGKGA